MLAVIALADQLQNILQVTAALVRQQRRVDLTGLDERMGRLCAAVLDLPYAQGCEMRPRLQDLHDRLGQLAAAVAAPDPAPRMEADS